MQARPSCRWRRGAAGRGFPFVAEGGGHVQDADAGSAQCVSAFVAAPQASACTTACHRCGASVSCAGIRKVGAHANCGAAALQCGWWLRLCRVTCGLSARVRWHLLLRGATMTATTPMTSARSASRIMMTACRGWWARHVLSLASLRAATGSIRCAVTASLVCSPRTNAVAPFAALRLCHSTPPTSSTSFLLPHRRLFFSPLGGGCLPLSLRFALVSPGAALFAALAYCM